METMAMKIQGRSFQLIHLMIDMMILLLILSMVAFAGYSLWDSNQVFRAADKSQYERYKPSEDGKSFEELQRINSEVIAWLTVYGTNIDYPVTQGENNMKYVNTDAQGQYSLSGAIFLDSNNNSDFRDFNNIFYGHHMEKQTMFGEIETFYNKDTFESRRYGNLYFDDKDYGIEFFAFIHTDAYNRQVFTANVTEEKQEYLDNLLANAIHAREIGVSIQDNIVLLTTCSASSTNGRDILIGRITEDAFENPFSIENVEEARVQLTAGAHSLTQREVNISVLGALLLAFMMIIIIYYVAECKRRKRNR